MSVDLGSGSCCCNPLAGDRRVTARAVKPGDDDTDEIKGQESVERGLRPSRERNGTAIGFGNEEGAESGDRGDKADDGGRFFLGLAEPRGLIKLWMKPRDFLAHDHRHHLEGG